MIEALKNIISKTFEEWDETEYKLISGFKIYSLIQSEC